MRFKKSAFILMVFVLSLSLLVSGCGGNKNAAETGSSTASLQTTDKTFNPMSKYEPVLTINVIEETSAERKYLTGESFDNNVWTKAYEEQLGIKFNYLWTADSAQFNERFNIALASDDLPDILSVEYVQFYKLAKAGKLQDIGEVYEKYASPMLREFAEKAEKFAIKNCTIDGKLYGLSDAPDIQNRRFLWLRDDWMKKLKLAPPKNMDDVVNIARAFATQDPDGNSKADTFGIGMDKEIWSGGMDMSGFANGYHAYPRMWIEKDGKLAYGSIQPEIKTVLAKLQYMYNEGLLDKEFPLKDTWEKAPDVIRSSKVGLIYGALWIPYWAPVIDLINVNPEATWTHYPIPSVNDKPALSHMDATLQYAICVTNKFKNPEALIKMANFINLKLYDEEQAEQKYHDQDGIETFWGMKLVNGIPSPAYYNINSAVKINDALNTGDTSKLNPEQKGEYDKVKLWIDTKDATVWGNYAVTGPGGTMLTTKQLIEEKRFGVSKYTGPETPTMTDKKENLKQKEVEIFTQIIMGASIDKFDEWVEYYNAQGGLQITAEVNEWWDAQAK